MNCDHKVYRCPLVSSSIRRQGEQMPCTGIAHNRFRHHGHTVRGKPIKYKEKHFCPTATCSTTNYSKHMNLLMRAACSIIVDRPRGGTHTHAAYSYKLNACTAPASYTTQYSQSSAALEISFPPFVTRQKQHQNKTLLSITLEVNSKNY